MLTAYRGKTTNLHRTLGGSLLFNFPATGAQIFTSAIRVNRQFSACRDPITVPARLRDALRQTVPTALGRLAAGLPLRRFVPGSARAENRHAFRWQSGRTADEFKEGKGM